MGRLGSLPAVKADLLRHGLLRASFIPPAPMRAIRELTRYRKTLVQERVDEANRLQKTLEGANLKLAAVASDVVGVSGRAMLAAVLDGERDPDVPGRAGPWRPAGQAAAGAPG